MPSTPSPLSAELIPVGGLRVWYHLPFNIADESAGNEAVVAHDLEVAGWEPKSQNCTLQQAHYFHSFVSSALWEGGRQNVPALFDHFHKPRYAGSPFDAIFDSPWKSGAIEFVRRRVFRGRIKSVELRRLRERSDRKSVMRGFGMLIVCVEFRDASNTVVRRGRKDGVGDFKAMTLADAQDALDLTRRLFPRWHSFDDPDLPGDALSRVRCVGAAPTAKEMNLAHEGGEGTPLMPWVRDLVSPYALDGEGSDHFGDERAYITSALLLGTGGESERHAFDLLTRVKESDLFRLAEVDRRGDDYNYNKKFLQTLAPSYFYTRQSPDPDTGTGQTSLFITSSHHLCVVGTGRYFKNVILGNGIEESHDIGHVEEYYRHMQFLCVFEYCRLIQFSKRLTHLIRMSGDRMTSNGTLSGDGSEFGETLTRIRDEFLDFTHLHHFSNISSQLQPRELFSRLYQAFGLSERFAEVEKELEAATSFHDMRVNAAERRDSANLNRLVSAGVPLSLIIGAAGMNLFSGRDAPFGLGTKGPAVFLFWQQFAQLALITALVGGIWGIFEHQLNSQRSNGRSGREFKVKQRIGVWPIVCAAAICAFFVTILVHR